MSAVPILAFLTFMFKFPLSVALCLPPATFAIHMLWGGKVVPEDGNQNMKRWFYERKSNTRTFNVTGKKSEVNVGL